MSTPNPLASPALSATSNISSFIMLSNNTPSLSAPRSDDSDDEIIYGVSEDSSLSADESLDSTASDNDFVVLSRPKSQRSILETVVSTPHNDDDARADTPGITDLTIGLASLRVDESGSGRRKQKAKADRAAVAPTGAVAQKKSQPSPVNVAPPSSRRSSARSKRVRPKSVVPLTASIVAEKQAIVKTKSKKAKKEKSTGYSGRFVVDDVSKYGDNDVGSPSVYEEASGFITSFLANPAARQDSACRLTLLQALIIELGLTTSPLPSSLTAAKAYLKSRAFVNINEYIAVRNQGPAAVQRIMYPSRSALVKDIRKGKNKASLGRVKRKGLEVLLVKGSH